MALLYYKKVRRDDAYTAGGMGGARPDRCLTVYANRCKEAYQDVPIIVGGIEASLRRIAHFDYWSNKVRRSVLLDTKADLKGKKNQGRFWLMNPV